ncbi:hypothetical protein SKAU_G00421300 [Synaphobranchus kaupii]|uniref:Uncharacterized protein n=1 Tax=Synaphobranchus kaupii TaxID=118154 RepID=A0A9Q1E6P6_SYNKA|nr:hypothetical protein SKAU_G00421300 [Synaphobranchus kaupii]
MGLPPFYASVLEAWRILKVTRDPAATAGLWLLEEPLFYSSFIQARTLSSASIRTAMREAGCTKLGHLLTPAGILQQRINIRPRLLNGILTEICASLPEHLRMCMKENCVLAGQWEENVRYSFPRLAVSPNVGEWQEGEGCLLSFKTPQLEEFEGLGNRLRETMQPEPRQQGLGLGKGKSPANRRDGGSTFCW